MINFLLILWLTLFTIKAQENPITIELDPLTGIKPIICDTTPTTVKIALYADHVKDYYCYGYLKVGSTTEKMDLLSIDYDKTIGQSFTFTDLTPGKSYDYVAGIYYSKKDDLVGKVSFYETSKAFLGTFTLPSDAASNYTFAFGSCRFIPHVFGRPFLSKLSDMPYSTLCSLHQQNFDIKSVFFLGDQVYLDLIKQIPFVRLTQKSSINRLYNAAYSTPGFSKLCSSIETKCLPDDHEYRDNGTPEQGESEPEIYKTCMQAINFYQHPLRPLKASVLSSYGIIFDRCGLQFFMADTRFERTKDHIMSDHQMDKLKKWLLTYRWEPKFLLTPVSMFLQRYDDCWYGYQKDLYSIVDFLYTNDIHNLFVLTGDAHSSAVGEFLINNSYPVIKTPTSPESLKVVEVMSSSFYQLFHDSASNYYGQMDLNDPSGAGDTYFLRHAYGQDALREQVIQENNFCLSHYDHLRKTIQFRFYKSGGDLIKKYDFPLAIKPAYQSIFIESDQ